MFGAAAEIFEDKFIPFLPKVFNTFQKLIRDEHTNRLHVTLSETIGIMVMHILDEMTD